MKLNSPTCENAATTGTAVAVGVPRTHGQEGRERLDEDHDHEHERDRQWRDDDAARIEEHAYRHEEEHREGVAHRQGVAGGAGRELGAADGDAGQERPQLHRDAEQAGRADGDAHREHQYRQREQLPRARPLDVLERPGHHPAAEHHDRDHQADELDAGEPQGHAGSGTALRLRPEEDREQQQHGDGEDVLDDGPADRDVADRRVQVAPLREHERHDHRAGDGDGHSENDARRPRPAQQVQQYC
jgi:hypothetical protein